MGEKKTAQQVGGNHIMRQNIEYVPGNQVHNLHVISFFFFLINHSFLLIKQVLCLINCSGNLIYFVCSNLMYPKGVKLVFL